jgi:prophage DNA circulation protein
MYRRVNSGRFIGLTTAGIVIVMAVFTWVMYGMAQQVYTMTDVMVELNQSFKAMVVTQTSMAADMHSINANVAVMGDNIADMTGNIGNMTGTVALLNDAMRSMAGNLNRMTYDVGQATYAVTNPMSYMWGNPFPF